MAQPNPYDRAFNFSNFQASNPAQPLPAGPLDEEFSRVKAFTDQIRANLALIQRDDTALANNSVGFDQLKAEVMTGINPPTPWETATSYVARDTVFESNNFYICLESHVSTVFLTDLADGKWELLAAFNDITSATSVDYDNSLSGLAATNVQAAIDEIENIIDGFNAGVLSFEGRSGAVTAAAGDYDAAQVNFDASGLVNTNAGDVQEAIEDHDAAFSGKAALVHTHSQADITDLISDLAGKVPTSRQIATSGLAAGGGDLTTSRTINVPIASQTQAESGSNNNVAMTPLRTAEAIAAQVTGAAGTFTTTDGKTVTVTDGLVTSIV